MPYKAWFLFALSLVALYLLMGAVTTCVMRLTNPLRRKCKAGKTLCLTFDDGMDSRYTPQLLDLLARHKIHASFFVLASTVEKHPELLRRMEAEGHTIGIHSFDHRNQILELPHRLCRDFERSIGIFSSHSAKPSFYRPPWGHITPLGIWLCRKYQLQMILWTVIVGDWKSDTTVELLCQKLRKQVCGSAVICLHDGRGKNAAPLKTIGALERMIPEWKEEGYVFQTVSEFMEESTA